MSEFHFASTRITVAQICRAAGLERSVPSVLDAFTDIMIQYLTMLGTTARDIAESRGSDDANADDAMLAAVECGAVRGGLNSTELRNGREKPYTGIEDIIELINWLRGPSNARMVAVARPQRQLAASIGAAQGAALAALPSSAAAASKFKKNGDSQEQQELLSADIQNSLANSNQQSAGQAAPPPPPPFSQEQQQQPQLQTPQQQHTQQQYSDQSSLNNTQQAPDNQQDWLRMAFNRQVLMGHRDWFVNTELGQRTEPDPTIYGQ